MGRRFPGRFKLARELSTIAAARVAPRSLDFIYLDARHDYKGVAEDLRAWWPALRSGGVYLPPSKRMSNERNDGLNLYLTSRASQNMTR